MRTRAFVAITVVAVALTGCTTIVNHVVSNINHVIGAPSAKKSQPGLTKHASIGAKVTVVKRGEKPVFDGAPPTQIVLGAKARHGWKVTGCTIKISMHGYYSEKLALKKTADGWHVDAYVGLGKVIGWFVLNPANGGIYTLSPDQLRIASSENGQYQPDINRISVVTIDSVPKSLKSKTTLVGYLSPKKSKGAPNGRK